MKITVPDYYRDFKCIAGACEDTCCAGWEVDVDEDSFRRYKRAAGSIGNRLRAVMIPKEDGWGCSFRLTPDKRCPFLNESKLCDIYTELGEEALCETCTNFPRFVHDYGAVREIGTAPSCFTAAQLMVKKRSETTLETDEDFSIVVTPNDIDPESFFFLKNFRSEIFDILWKKDIGLQKKLVLILKKAEAAQDYLSHKKDNLQKDKSLSEDVIRAWLSPFEGMEIINSDWVGLLEEHNRLCRIASDSDGLKQIYEAFDKEVTFAEGAFTQLVFYYLYRYVLEAVHDLRLLCAVKTGAVAYLAVKRLCVARFFEKGSLSEDDMADIFHLYSRQIEHSDINFEYYREAYDTKPEYGLEVILNELT